jgi:hypothetical protein
MDFVETLGAVDIFAGTKRDMNENIIKKEIERAEQKLIDTNFVLAQGYFVFSVHNT